MAKGTQMRVSVARRSESGHDIIVVGTSLGGFEALPLLLGPLDPDLPAAVFIVRHTASHAQPMLDRILASHCALPVEFGQDGSPIRPGTVYLAPPDYHMLISGDHIRLVAGPRENWTRPAIDPLFRSAAASYRSRVIGVVLSGLLDDGTAGLVAVKRCGGIAVVQHPDDAIAPEMVQSALRNVDVDHTVAIRDMGRLLNTLVRQPAADAPPVPQDLALEVELTETINTDIRPEYKLGDPSPYVCPECGGALWEIESGNSMRYRCHVGHAFGVNALLQGQHEDLERALWAAVRIFEQHVRLLDKLASEADSRRQSYIAKSYQDRRAEFDEQAGQIRGFLASRRPPSLPPEESPAVESALLGDGD